MAHLFPLPLDSGGKIKSYYTLKALASAHDVSVIAYGRSDDELAQLDAFREICSKLRVVTLARPKSRLIRDAACSLFTRRSFIVSRDFRSDMQSVIDAELQNFRPDVVHIDHLQMAQFVDFDSECRIVLDHHNVESMIVKRIGESPGSLATRLYAKLEWPKLQSYELDICRRSDLVLTVSEEDRSTLCSLEPSLNNVHPVPIGVDVDFFQLIERQPKEPNMVSIATMYWPPNVDSMLYFHNDILPIVRKRVPNSILTIAGQRPVASIQALASTPGVRVTGYVDDTREIARDCGVFIVPLRSGSGVRVKLLNAMAMGLPIVSTSVGAEGLDVVSGEHLLIADTAREFADAVVRLLEQPQAAAEMGANARKLVCAKYSWEKIGAELLDTYQRMAH